MDDGGAAACTIVLFFCVIAHRSDFVWFSKAIYPHE